MRLDDQSELGLFWSVFEYAKLKSNDRLSNYSICHYDVLTVHQYAPETIKVFTRSNEIRRNQNHTLKFIYSIHHYGALTVVTVTYPNSGIH